MHVDVVNTVINRPVVDVSHYAADSDNGPRWYEAINLSNDDAFADFAERLIARFGGRVIERTVVDGPR